MNKHTPGPWEIDNRPHSAINHGKKHVAMVNFWNAVDEEVRVDEQEHQANARLIAAAPEMLDACQEVVRYVEHGYDLGPNLMDQLRTAIAKAKGEL